MTRLYLYGTAACHLCDEAVVVLQTANQQIRFDWLEIDIAENGDLLRLYGNKIPVLGRDKDSVELCWPFSVAAVLSFVQAA